LALVVLEVHLVHHKVDQGAIHLLTVLPQRVVAVVDHGQLLKMVHPVAPVVVVLMIAVLVVTGRAVKVIAALLVAAQILVVVAVLVRLERQALQALYQAAVVLGYQVASQALV
jgi:hypothetical protein